MQHIMYHITSRQNHSCVTAQKAALLFHLLQNFHDIIITIFTEKEKRKSTSLNPISTSLPQKNTVRNSLYKFLLSIIAMSNPKNKEKRHHRSPSKKY
ncbi:hypothetical protein CDL12_24568 [Handroanthus impetiginosus]|uniref:Uncharacterized protein n=1 Tax=Handroanthus impetiginosus TaxID=429701 RepID=A0A2G9GC95_9LAMI|nr:hypothetical protein CDL12_24568 [Handroanthus impetiginosus]